MHHRINFLAVFLFSVSYFAAGQNEEFDSIRALDEWRWGVISYNDGLIGKALMSIERAISLDPDNVQAREWLGRIYWRSGEEAAALSVWEEIINQGEHSTALLSWHNRLSRRISGEQEIPVVNDEWLPLLSLDGFSHGGIGFNRPTSVRPFGDGSGSMLVVSYGGGEIIKLDANGEVVDRFKGGVGGLRRPFDALMISENSLLVSEFQSNRLSVISTSGLNRGYRIDSWGSAGRGMNEFLGPQFLCLSADGNFVYVSDWGNKRVSKWSLKGEHVLSYESGPFFDGFSGPSGIAVRGDRVYIADSLGVAIYVFDPSGNYIETLNVPGLGYPEGLYVRGEHLFIADGPMVRRLNLDTGEIKTEAQLGAGEHRLTSVSRDDNGNLVIADFAADRVIYFTPLSTLYGGLEITINSVRMDSSLEVLTDLTVRDRRGFPVSGLNESNFVVYDALKVKKTPQIDWDPVQDRSLAVSVFANNSGSREAIERISTGVRELTAFLGSKDNLFVVSPGDKPVAQKVVQNKANDSLDLLYNSVPPGVVEWDEYLRVAASAVLNEHRRKAVIVFVDSLPGKDAFDVYGLVQTARLMANNDVIFYAVYLVDNVSPELEYIVSETGGESYFIYQPEGISKIISKLRNRISGRYRLSWKMDNVVNYGRRFIPVAVEVMYIKKSGRDEMGNFIPLG